MGRMTRSFGPQVTIAAGVAIWLVVMVSVAASPSSRHSDPTSVPASAPADPALKSGAGSPAQASAPATGYVGEQTCLTCHEENKKGYHGSPHARAQNPRTPAGKAGCESCHGPGQAHVDAGGDKTKIKNPRTMTPSQVSDLCLTCHNRSSHDQWEGSKHNARNLSCTTCHSVHDPKSEKGQLKTATQIETCVQCHQKEVNKLHKAAHMPVREGKLQCTSCHNPHGSQNVKMLREGNSIVEACTSCHAEKRGPFLWEHQPVRENCLTCHDAHGSNNERLLVAKLPMLCQRCHIASRHPATIYDNTQVNITKSNRVVGRACVNCHSTIHGSNHPTSGKVFVR